MVTTPRTEKRPLSVRERQVLDFAALEHSNKEIAYELELAASTVRVLLLRAARKLGVRGRAAAIALFRRSIAEGRGPLAPYPTEGGVAP